MKMKISLFTVITFSLLVTSCGNNDDRDAAISLSGAFALYPLAQKWAEEYQKIHPDVRFDIQAGGAGKGMADALSGTVDVGMFSREITDVEKTKGIWWIALTKDAVFPTVNSQNPYIDIIRKRGLKKTEFESIFINQQPASWEALLQIPGTGNTKINSFTRSDASGAADSWASFFGKKQENLKGIGIFGDPGVADAVRKDKGSIGYNNTLYVYDINSGKRNEGIEVLPIDVNENGKIDPEEDFYETLPQILSAVNTGKYPSPPARNLYFITKGKPQRKEILDFFHWVLTDGQAFVTSAGYVHLLPEAIDEEKKKLEK